MNEISKKKSIVESNSISNNLLTELTNQTIDLSID
jgi:hypothetical protein